MSVVKSSTTRVAVEATNGTPLLTPEQVVEQLRAMQQQIPEFVQLPKTRDLQQLRRVANVDEAFTHEGISVVGASNVVQEAIGNTPEDLHHAEDEIARWAVVESELRAVLRGVIAANLVRRHRIGLAVLQAYNVSRQLVRQQEHAHLLPHVESMTRLRRFSRRRNKTVAPTQPPAPQPGRLP